MSEPLPSFTAVESPKVESAPNSNQGVFSFFEKASLRTQQLVIASITGLIALLVVVAVIQLSANIVPLVDNTAFSQVAQRGLVALVTAVAVAVTTFALGLISSDRINRGINHLQAQFNAVACGDLGIHATVDSPKELAQLALSFNQMTRAIDTKLSEAQKKADEQKKATEDLQHQLVQLLQNTEENFPQDLTVQPEETPTEATEQPIAPEGTVLDFLDNLNNITKFRESINPNLLLNSSTLEELQQHKDELEYRQLWLQAILEETHRELNFLALLIESAQQNQQLSN